MASWYTEVSADWTLWHDQYTALHTTPRGHDRHAELMYPYRLPVGRSAARWRWRVWAQWPRALGASGPGGRR